MCNPVARASIATLDDLTHRFSTEAVDEAPYGKKSHPARTSVLDFQRMSGEGEPQRLRVGVLGSGAEGAYWASDLGGRGVDVIFFQSLDALLEAQVGLATTTARPTCAWSSASRSWKKITSTPRPPRSEAQ